MAMAPSDMQEFFRQQVKLFSEGAEKTLAGGKLHVVSSNVETAFHACLMIALLTWRSEKAVPRNELLDAIELARWAVAMVSQRNDGVPVWRSFNVGPVRFLEVLAGHSPGFLAAACPRREWQSVGN